MRKLDLFIVQCGLCYLQPRQQNKQPETGLSLRRQSPPPHGQVSSQFQGEISHSLAFLFPSFNPSTHLSATIQASKVVDGKSLSLNTKELKNM